MNIDILLTPLEILPDRVGSCVVVVIDVFRATSCICNAIATGAKELFPVTTIDQALKMRQKLGDTNKVLLAGERKTRLIDGFDLDNSPFSYTGHKIRGASIVMSTTNGTRALESAVKAGAARVFVASFLNATAVAKFAGTLGLDVVVVCAARHDRYTIEDALCAGMIAGIIESENIATLSDVAWMTTDFYNRYSDNLRVPLINCAHYNQIMKGGMADDVAYCLERDVLTVIPELDVQRGSITDLRQK